MFSKNVVLFASLLPTIISATPLNAASSYPGFDASSSNGNAFHICPDKQPGQKHCVTPKTVLKGYDYVIVGSGPGGGPLAANLARAGHKILLIEAGNDNPNINYSVPIFSFRASEDPTLSWSFFVEHYQKPAQQERDPKLTYITPSGTEYTGFNPPPGSTIKGILYPRGATVGGSAGHNALAWIYPDASDWDNIASLTNDSSFNSANMRHYYEELENCQYEPKGTPGHGFHGYLSTNICNLPLQFTDQKQVSMFSAAAQVAGTSVANENALFQLLSRDINAYTRTRDSEQGLYTLPYSMNGDRRSSPREFIAATVAATNPDGSRKYHLDVRTKCLATRVFFDTTGKVPRAAGVEFLDGTSLYRADVRSASASNGSPGVVHAKREVILSGGTFNTPQLLKLSGVGAPRELKKFGITPIVNLPGVGTNMQDRYEASIVVKGTQNFTTYDGCTFATPGTNDPCLASWEAHAHNNGTLYATDGVLGGVLRRSTTASTSDSDLYIFGGAIVFRGYFPGYSVEAFADTQHYTWSVLKAHAGNRAGTVKLTSADPRAVPSINFNYFTDNGANDAQAVVEGLQFARSIFAAEEARPSGTQYTEMLPGANVTTAAQLAQYVRDYAWGHHASCSCPIGADGDPMAVLDSSFRVRGTAGLRVVDASAFPAIPGIFVQVPIYQLSQKAFHVINADASA